MRSYECRLILFTTGCFESSRYVRGIPGTRPAGSFTTGALKQLVNLRHLKLGKRAVIGGSEHVALSSVLALRNAVAGAWAGTGKIWEGSPRRLIASTRYPLPVEKFDWKRADSELEIIFKIHSQSQKPWVPAACRGY